VCSQLDLVCYFYQLAIGERDVITSISKSAKTHPSKVAIPPTSKSAKTDPSKVVIPSQNPTRGSEHSSAVRCRLRAGGNNIQSERDSSRNFPEGLSCMHREALVGERNH